MTDKQIVEDFLHFLNTHKGYIVTDTGADQTYNYLELRKAIINCLTQAMEDGYKKGQVEAEAAALGEENEI
jgi:hypothetical protein